MNPEDIKSLAAQLAAGKLSVDEFLQQMPSVPRQEIDEAHLDFDRQKRCGFPEVVFGEGKTLPTLEKIFHRLLKTGVPVFATRITAAMAQSLSEMFPSGNYHPLARTFRITNESTSLPHRGGKVAVLTAGTSDLPIAEEARETLDWMGVEVVMVHDVGVAGPHRLPSQLAKFRDADAVVVVAGMEGALPSVVGGYVACPVIGVPTSVGYGANFGGVSALLSMLNSCASNVTVVNIDSGFKGGYVAGLIARRVHAAHTTKA